MQAAQNQMVSQESRSMSEGTVKEQNHSVGDPCFKSHNQGWWAGIGVTRLENLQQNWQSI